MFISNKAALFRLIFLVAFCHVSTGFCPIKNNIFGYFRKNVVVSLDDDQKKNYVVSSWKYNNARSKSYHLWATPRGGENKGVMFGGRKTTTNRGRRRQGIGLGSSGPTNQNQKITKTASTTNGNGLDGIVGAWTPLFEIDASEIKVGPLRFLLQLFLSGDVMNRPTPKSWFIAKRGVSDEAGGVQSDEKQTLEVYYKDGTGMILIEILPNKIHMNRVGVQPSLVYQLQESLLLHSVLDELTRVAFEQPEDQRTLIDPSQRLLQLYNPQAIEEARKHLPARASDDT